MRRIWIAILLWALAGVASAKSPAFVASPAAITSPFLWSVQGPKATGESYLLGTVHIGVSAKEMPRQVWEALRRSKTIVSEADISQAKGANLQKYTYYTPPQTLTKALGKEKAQTIATALGSTLEAVQNMRPWFASSLLVLKLEANTSAMLDKELQSAAKSMNKQSLYLETLEEQLQMLSGLDDKMMSESLYAIASDMAKARADYALMTKYYRAGDTKSLQSFMQKEMAKIAGMETVLLQKRNANWIPKLASQFAKGPTFVAVGAAHLLGPGSVIDLLRDQGYKITRIP